MTVEYTGNRIHSKGPYTHEEYVGGEAGIYPGMLLELQSDDTVDIHSDENGRAEAIFAEEDALQGKAIGDVYTVANIVSCILPMVGCEIRALIQDGQDISIGERLVSAGDGTLKSLGTLDSEAIDVFVIAIAMETCDASDSRSPTIGAFCRVRITAGN